MSDNKEYFKSSYYLDHYNMNSNLRPELGTKLYIINDLNTENMQNISNQRDRDNNSHP